MIQATWLVRVVAETGTNVPRRSPRSDTDSDPKRVCSSTRAESRSPEGEKGEPEIGVNAWKARETLSRVASKADSSLATTDSTRSDVSARRAVEGPRRMVDGCTVSVGGVVVRSSPNGSAGGVLVSVVGSTVAVTTNCRNRLRLFWSGAVQGPASPVVKSRMLRYRSEGGIETAAASGAASDTGAGSRWGA